MILVGGVGGWDVLGASAKFAFPRAGLDFEIHDFVWSHGWGQWLKDLQDARHLHKKATELAGLIREAAAEPERPIHVIAKSGGAGLALAAAEMLPPNTLSRLILLSAAVSPEYDLRPALRATKGQIVSFYSPYDQFILNFGTRQFGTVDRVYGPSAGLCGFDVPGALAPEDQALYRRLVQVQWSPRMLWQGNAGGHTGSTWPCFLQFEVAPWLKR